MIQTFIQPQHTATLSGTQTNAQLSDIILTLLQPTMIKVLGFRQRQKRQVRMKLTFLQPPTPPPVSDKCATVI